MRPVIGISSSQREDGGEIYLKKAYVSAVKDHGGLPVILPVCREEELIAEVLSHCHGLLLSGGGDIDPKFYHATNLLPEMEFDRERDEFEMGLARVALRFNMPIFGICRGLQVLNVCFGGTLIQDLEIELPGAGEHRNKPGIFGDMWHRVDLEPGGKLYDLLGSTMEVNSSHHQAVQEPGKGLMISGYSPDGVIEAIEILEKPWVIGVQWHPERMGENNRVKASLFDGFIRAAKEYMAGFGLTVSHNVC